MARPLKPITPGTEFGRLVVVGVAEPFFDKTQGFRLSASECVCKCGNRLRTRNASLLSGVTNSCGCLELELKKARKKHGLYRHPVYSVWRSMRERCNNPRHHAYDSYGGRGIEVCERWNDFETFLKDMGPRPDGASIDRIDNDKGYAPENCQWATSKTQMNNRDCNHVVSIDGIEKTLSEWCETFAISVSTVSSRISKGMNPVDAIRRPARSKVSLRGIMQMGRM